MLFGTLSLGEIAVDFFFLISGFLICQSFENSQRLEKFVGRRILRIYPAFIINTSFCLLILYLLGYAQNINFVDWAKIITRTILLNPPSVGGEFPDLHYHAINGAVWTVSYEFRCYLLLGALGVTGILKYRSSVLCAGLTLISLNSLNLFSDASMSYLYPLVGGIEGGVRFSGIFLCGATFYLYRDKIVYRDRYAAIAAAFLLPLLFFYHTAEISLTLLGGYILFWLCFYKRFFDLSASIKHDVSYGLYLYGWPLQILVVYIFGISSPIAISAIVLPLAILCGAFSWFCVERPFISYGKSILR